MDPEGVAAVEAAAFAAWPAAESRDEDGWVARFGDGFSRRLNSVTIASDAASDHVEARLTAAHDWLVARGVAPLVRVTSATPARTVAVLDALDYTTEGETLVMTGPIAPASPSPATELGAPSAGWLQDQERWMGIADPGPWRSVLARVAPPARFSEVDEGDRRVAAGLGIVRNGWLGIFEVTTDPARRRRGHATRLVGELCSWAAAGGASGAFLQVVASNEPAVALWRSLGFTTAYRYRYRRPPEAT